MDERALDAYRKAGRQAGKDFKPSPERIKKIQGVLRTIRENEAIRKVSGR